jgi:hypothetical protein
MPAGALVSPVQGKIDVALSQYAKGYRNNANLYVGNLLFPRVEVDNQSDKYWIWGREGQRVGENVLRAPGSAAERVFQSLSTGNYFARDHSLARFITDEERGNFQAGNVEEWATGNLTDKILLDFEKRVAAKATDPNQYPASNKVLLAGATQWNTAGTSFPIDDVLAGHLAIMKAGVRANTLIINPDVWMKLKTHADIKARVSPTQTGPVTTENLAAIFEVQRVLVAAGIELAADLATASFVWGKHAILAYVNESASIMDQSFGKTFVWRQAPGTVGGFQVEIGRINPPSAKSDELAVHSYFDEQLTSPITGYLIQNAVA